MEVGAGRQAVDLQLTELGPYNLDFSRSGRYLLLGGRKGHLALMDWHRMRNLCELQVSAVSVMKCLLIPRQVLALLAVMIAMEGQYK